MSAAAARTAPLERISDLALAPSVEAAVAAVVDVLGLEVAYQTRHVDGEQRFETLAGDGASFGVGPDTVMPLEATYCRRILDGELPNLMPDLTAHPAAMAVPVTEAAGVGAFCSVPLVLSDGSVYGTLCTGSHHAQGHLGERDLQFLQVLARIVADQIERDRRERAHREALVASAGVGALVAAVHARDGYTGEHSEAVVELAVAVAGRLALPDEEVELVRQVAVLHDVGKIGIPDAVLHKPGPLDDAEWAVMREHPAVGAQVVASLPGLERLVPCVRAEHERWDGGGYPDGLAGEEIPLPARIVLACDAYHAMTSDRPYRRAMSHGDAVGELFAGAGTQFCPSTVVALLDALA